MSSFAGDDARARDLWTRAVGRRLQRASQATPRRALAMMDAPVPDRHRRADELSVGRASREKRPQ